MCVPPCTYLYTYVSMWKIPGLEWCTFLCIYRVSYTYLTHVGWTHFSWSSKSWKSSLFCVFVWQAQCRTVSPPWAFSQGSIVDNNERLEVKKKYELVSCRCLSTIHWLFHMTLLYKFSSTNKLASLFACGNKAKPGWLNCKFTVRMCSPDVCQSQ